MRAYTLNKTFSDKVMEYMNKGYYLLPTEMDYLGGDYDGHVEMTNNKTIVRIAICNGERTYKSKELFDTKYIIVRSMPVRFYHNDSFWNPKESKVIEKIKLYEVVFEEFYLTEDEYKEKAIHIRSKQSKRFKYHDYMRYDYGYYKFDTDKVRNIAFSYMAKQPKCKTIKKKDIECVSKSILSNGKVCYTIVAKGKCFTLK